MLRRYLEGEIDFMSGFPIDPVVKLCDKPGGEDSFTGSGEYFVKALEHPYEHQRLSAKKIEFQPDKDGRLASESVTVGHDFIKLAPELWFFKFEETKSADGIVY